MRRPSPALVLSFVAVFLAATGGAVAGVQIGGKQIKDGSITGKDVKNNSLSGADVKGDVRGPEGPRAARAARRAPRDPPGRPPAASRSRTASRTDGRSGRCRSPEAPSRSAPAGRCRLGGSHRIQDGLALRFSDFGDLAGGNPDSWVAAGGQPDGGPAGRRASRWPASGRAASTLFNSSPRELAR